MKVKPVMDALEERGAQVILVHTGQRYDPAMSDAFFDHLGIRRADHFLGAVRAAVPFLRLGTSTSSRWRRRRSWSRSPRARTGWWDATRTDRQGGTRGAGRTAARAAAAGVVGRTGGAAHRGRPGGGT